MSAADRELVDGSSLVFRAYRSLDPASRGIIREWVSEMAVGMEGFVRDYPAGIRIQSLAEFKRYCYFVAGTVGHLLTDLWHAHSPFVGARTYGKPVGQYGYNFCDKVLYPVAFSTQNALGQGGYFDGIPADCAAADDLDHDLGTGRRQGRNRDRQKCIRLILHRHARRADERQ